jgi:aldose 1-epimerase
MDPKNFERDIDGKQTRLLTLKNDKGLEVMISNYGARIISLHFDGVNVTPGFPSLDAYASDIAPYHGATVGRYANRIADGKFTLNGRDYSLPTNNTPNHLHGGPNGFHSQVWEVENSYQNSVVLSYLSEDGEEGYPGEVKVSVSFSLSPMNELIIDYTARTNAATPFNITNHAFFNLNGEGTILNHQLQINAHHFTPVDATLIPTGEFKKVEGTAFDFTVSKTLGQHINNDEEQIKIGSGYDHNFVLDKKTEGLSSAAKAIGDKSGIVMEVFTEEPGIQLFSGNFEATKGDASTFRNTFCLETQHFPDSPNHPGFPNTILSVGESFSSKTVYKFSRLR